MTRVPRQQKQKIKRRMRLNIFRLKQGQVRGAKAMSSTGAAVGTLNRRKFFDSRLFVVVLIVLVGFLCVSVIRETIRRVQIGHEIRVVQEKLDKQKDRNAQMAILTNVLNTSVAQEKQSRLTLNSIAPGEKVIIIQSETDGGSEGTTADQIVLPNGETVDTIEQAHSGSNPKKWFDYFFRNL